ncbi:acyl-CoA desaturase-like [Ctenocephalides felis]|uniref:acyl-CoA desaturase-like n=1 Tax=Ctenocephalides felis TaxID=7515 RepID=UPI000E6E2F75|nr:acyl-CoA desaturase-like [Ctenocephalides felis]
MAETKTINTNNNNQEKEGKKILLPSQIGTDYNYKHKIVWFNTIGFLYLHLLAIYGIYRGLTGAAYFSTIAWMIFVGWFSGEGVTIGAHRLWTHRSFKAKLPLRLVLLILHTVAGQNCLWVWVRDHRQHHKYSDTDADPHNAKRGFFFSHIGWLMTRKHPLVFQYGKNIDMSDLEADKWVMFQKRYYKTLYIIFAIFLPTIVPVYFWGEDPWMSLLIAYVVRSIVMLNATWLVNSAAHLYGTRPYDMKLQPVENKFVSALSNGEGWHNYHHAFPWDYRAAELGRDWNCTTDIIDFCAKLGLAYDRKAAPLNMVMARIKRTGDGTHPKESKAEAEIVREAPTGIIDSTSGYPLMPSEWNAGEAPQIDPKYENYTKDTTTMVIAPDLEKVKDKCKKQQGEDQLITEVCTEALKKQNLNVIRKREIALVG